MYTLQRTQPIAPHCNGTLRLSGLISPYFQLTPARKRNPLRDIKIIPSTMILKALVSGWSIGGNVPNLDVYLESDDGTLSVSVIIPVTYAYSDTDLTLQAAANGMITSFCTGLGLPAPIIDWLATTPTDLAAAIAASAVPMYVSGVAKTGYYAVVAAPAVAGGAGVARFYIDSNGDGTGTAPSAVFSGSLQAVVPSSTATYQLQSFTVDTNRKYIDVKMGTLSTGLAGIIPILTGAIGNTANSTVVNCFVLVQK